MCSVCLRWCCTSSKSWRARARHGNSCPACSRPTATTRCCTPSTVRLMHTHPALFHIRHGVQNTRDVKHVWDIMMYGELQASFGPGSTARRCWGLTTSLTRCRRTCTIRARTPARSGDGCCRPGVATYTMNEISHNHTTHWILLPFY